MDFRFTNEEQEFRYEIRQYLQDTLGSEWAGIEPDAYFHEENWPHIRQLTLSLAKKGWLTLAWPKEYGGQGRTHVEQMIYNEEMAYFRAPTRDASTGTDLVGPTVMIYGTEHQKSKYLPRIADGTDVYCQGFSEPESGSDLASLELSALEDGDDYLLNGSKIWTSGAHRASHCYLMARTDPTAPKHKGISVFIIEMATPGIEIKPIINMFGIHYFNELVFDNARIPKHNIIGPENRGWYVAATSLDFERSGIARFASNQRDLEELVNLTKGIQDHSQSTSDYALIRHRISDLYATNEAGRAIAYNVAWAQSQGRVPNREASISKLMGSELSQKIQQLGMQISGLFAGLTKSSKWAYFDGRLGQQWMDSISVTIRGGTSEIQRHIIATRGLGLPRS